MQVTDQEIIDRRMQSWGEMQDGLHTFCAQGEIAIEMIVLRGQEVNKAGRTVDYDLYEIAIRKTSQTMDLTDITQFANMTVEELQKYEPVLTEYWDSQASAYARYMQLVIEHNHF